MAKDTEKFLEIITQYAQNSRQLIIFGIILGLLIIGYISASHQVPVIGTNGLTTNVTVTEIRNYYLHDDPTNNTDITNSTYTPYLSQIMRTGIDLNESMEFTNISNIANGNTLLVNWTSTPLNVTLFPHGIHTLHLHALKIGTGGSHVLTIFYD